MGALSTKKQAEELRREGVLANHIRASSGPFNPQTLARSYALTVARVIQIIQRNGGHCA